MPASISLLSPVGGVEATANYNVMTRFGNPSADLAGDNFLGAAGISSIYTSQWCPLAIPFDGTITLCNVMWRENNTPFDIRVYINQVMIQAISSTLANETLTFNVPVVTGDLMAVEISENPVTGITNWYVFTAFILEGV